jgi:hypothetical protein
MPNGCAMGDFHHLVAPAALEEGGINSLIPSVTDYGYGGEAMDLG